MKIIKVKEVDFIKSLFCGDKIVCHQKDAKNRFKEVKDFKDFYYIFTKRKTVLSPEFAPVRVSINIPRDRPDLKLRIIFRMIYLIIVLSL
jgi:hypothetical protein